MNPGEAVRRERLRKKAEWFLKKENLFYFARDICGYDRLIEDFHGPICRWLAESAHRLYLYWSAARGHYKTTIQIADVLQDILLDPSKTHLWVHNTLSQAEKAARELAWHLQYNDNVRALWPEHCAPKKGKFFKSASQDGTATFIVWSRRFSRSGQPTFTACSIDKDVTGMHISGSVRMDDLISADTIGETGGLQKVADYWAHTVIPVMDPGCVARNTGTRWDASDLYGKWVADENWATLVRAVLEDEKGQPDWKGKNVGVISDEELEFRRREMGSLFGPQMMNDPAPAQERLWDQSRCEHALLSQMEAREGRGRYVLLGDPAPYNVGSVAWQKEVERGNLEKDDWAWAVVRLRRNGTRQEILLMDGSFAKAWDEDEGMDEGARLAQKWGCTHAFIESAGGLGGAYEKAWSRACRRAGIRCNWAKFASTTKKDGKNYRVASLASRAKQEEFLICDSTPSETFLKAFYEQIRPYRKIAPGKNNLKNDDVVDVVAYATDPEVEKLSPLPEVMLTDEELDMDLGPAQWGKYI